MLYYLLFLLPPEVAHSLVIMILRKLPAYTKPIELPESLSTNFFGNKIKSPIGLAAGFDKNAEIIQSISATGFGFIEAGTVTLNPQYGNKKPRIFRLIKDKGIINRLGFNNKGIDYFLEQISNIKSGDCVFGINIGRNSESRNQIDDYINLIKKVRGKSNYIVLNISSPNTHNLRKLHNKQELSQLLTEIHGSIDKTEPIMLKISPDINQQTKEDIAELVIECKIDGLIVSNTTTSRENVNSYQNEPGGLSGKPLFKLSTELLRDMYKLTSGKIFLIGCGGVSSGTTAYEKIKAGASLVQLYTALIYHGPKIVNKINLELAELISRDGFTNISEAIGCEAR
ncbi:dihydroorotate dehydrogenase (quinone) [Wolbachia pipientis]|uniref:Dihydroorotate dehydrogenase (quinone) n=1 Tax=Wolbachia pipientis TaxID=955 RepID=A0A1E7QKX8_WOLPI|nr:quinone-dependent dihydroorotate dehydrogenase [Wolbachia pipientis]OEY87132.1 dihydroorotate dehydrogenase (quinone) [Wolbachia pipientis]